MSLKRILIFNVNWLGDVLFSTAVIRNIRRNFPDSYLACAVPSRCYHILKGNPHLDEVIIFDEHDRHKGMMEKLKFVQFLKKKKFDTVYLLHRSFTRTLLCRLADIPQRIGYHTNKRAFLLTKSIVSPDPNTLHRIDYYLTLIEKAGLRVEDRESELFIEQQDLEAVDDFLVKNGIAKKDFIAVINPGGNWHLKRWPKEDWAKLADRLNREFKAKVIVSGSASDIKLYRQIQDLAGEKMICACGIFTLKRLGALSKRADLFITADTGPLHIANATGAKKIIALFGPTDPQITGPYPLKNVTIIQKDIGCKIPCYILNCKDNRCMKAISVEDVLSKI